MSKTSNEDPRRTRDVPAEVRVARGSRPLVAIVGRPNVGKSTLFNRLVGAHIAIVEDVAGVTRDRHYADAEIRGRLCVVVDTGGFDPHSKDPVLAGVRDQVRLAISEADVVVFVTDATTALIEADREAVRLLRGGDRPVVYVANKADSPRRDAEAFDLYSLGVDHVVPVSALHGRGMTDLEEAVHSALRESPTVSDTPDIQIDDDVPRVAVVGRPNAGKSSLINRLIGADRLLVDDRPGTTTDAIDTMVVRGEHKYVFVDTAGIRRRRSVNAPLEMTSVMQAIRAIERADVVVLLCDISDSPLADQDLRILSLAEERGRGIIVGLNKVDQLDASTERKLVGEARRRISFADWIPIVKTSAKQGRGTSALLEMIDRVYASFRRRVTTSETNEFFTDVIERHPPPSQSNRPVRIYYTTQVGTRPPRFAAVTNQPEYVAESYTRYLQNQLRERCRFEGGPVRISYREKRRRKFQDAES